METNKYTHRILARVVLEAASPLCVGNGEKDIITDAQVATDVNGLPYIPGTALAGLFRHAIEEAGADVNDFFGFQKGNQGKGSEIIFSDGRMVGKEGKVLDGLLCIDFKDAFYSSFAQLPIRQHVRIGHRGTADNHGKFDQQVVFKGTRFVFEIEAVSDGSNEEMFSRVLDVLTSETFRIGGGSRKGFGEVRIIEVKKSFLDLSDTEMLHRYAAKSSALSDTSFWGELPKDGNVEKNSGEFIRYELTLKPDDFFLFGSGFASDNADISPVKEDVIIWKDGIPSIQHSCVLIPASSLKGAIAHRTAFYYNKQNQVFADKLERPGDALGFFGKENFAVRALFGSEGANEQGQRRGAVIFSDIVEKTPASEKLLNHVSIDRFTGGAIDGAKFDEEVTDASGQAFQTTIFVDGKCLDEYCATEKCVGESAKGDVLQAFEKALKDVVTGMLPLGGGVNRGHGIFGGECKVYDNNRKGGLL